jgi:Transglycosylase SLT domain
MKAKKAAKLDLWVSVVAVAVLAGEMAEERGPKSADGEPDGGNDGNEHERMIPATRSALRFGVAVCAALVCSCGRPYQTHERFVTPAQLRRAVNMALSWPSPSRIDALKGAVLLRDGPPVVQPEIAIARAVLHDNSRLSQTAALLLAVVTVREARAHALPPEFLAATLLQESAYDVEALSSAGAIGIAQFMPETAREVGIDPYDPLDAIAGAATLLGDYVVQYRNVYDDPYSTALAAYNAGPVAVERYGGIPPYHETREYVSLIFDRWAGIVSYER